MTTRTTDEGDTPLVTTNRKIRWNRLLWAAGVPALLLLLLLSILWKVFFHYVPPGQMLIIVSKDGAELRPDQVLAAEGQKGIQKTVLGEGWHYVTPILYTTELKPNILIRSGHVGVVTALGGDAPARVLYSMRAELRS